MATNPRFPNAQEGISVGLPAPSHAYYNWFRTLNDAVNNGTISVDAANSLITALSARVDALEGGGSADDLLAALYGTNGIGVFGDITSGVEIRGPDLTAIRQSIPPGRDGDDGEDSYIPGPKGDKGDTGPAGSGGGGMTIIVQEDHYDDVWPFPGPKGDTGAAGGGGGSGYSEGTSFPGSPSNNDKYFRTDLDKLCFYDGTRWLTVAEFPVAGTQYSSPPFSSTNTGHTRYSVPSAANLYLTRVTMYLYVLTTSSGTQYWTFNLYQYTSAEAQIGGTLGTASTISQAANTIVRNDVTLNVALDSTARAFYPIFTKVSTPGNLYPAYTIWAREIIT